MRIKALITIGLLLNAGRLSAGKPDPSARFWLGGDVHLGAGGHRVLAPLSPVFENAPGFVNLEGAVRIEPNESVGGKLFNAESALIELSAAGIRAASIANNHALDAGADGPRLTARALSSHKIAPAGLAAGFATIILAGKRIVFTSHDLSSGVPEALRADLTKAKGAGDLLVATFHLSGPPSYLPSPELKKAVEIALLAGARVIAAHGSHRLGPVERRGDAVIAWGLGNLVFACDCTRETDAMLLEIAIGPDGELDAAAIPIIAGINGKPAAPDPHPGEIFDLLEAIGSPKLKREGNHGRF